MNKEIQTDMPSDKDILDHMELPFEPIDGRVLVKPLEPIKLTKEVTEIDYDATQKARAKADKAGKEIPEAVTKTETKEVEANLRVGVVLAIGEEEAKTVKPPYEVGDKVVYVHKAAMPFELFKDSVLIKRYEVLGKWSEIKGK